MIGLVIGISSFILYNSYRSRIRAGSGKKSWFLDANDLTAHIQARKILRVQEEEDNGEDESNFEYIRVEHTIEDTRLEIARFVNAGKGVACCFYILIIKKYLKYVLTIYPMAVF